MILSLLEQQIQKLIHLHQQSIVSNKKLSEKINELEKRIEHQSKLILELEEKNKVAKLANSLITKDSSNAELKQNINEYIKEIDRCIALLNKEPL